MPEVPERLDACLQAVHRLLAAQEERARAGAEGARRRAAAAREAGELTARRGQSADGRYEAVVEKHQGSCWIDICNVDADAQPTATAATAAIAVAEATSAGGGLSSGGGVTILRFRALPGGDKGPAEALNLIRAGDMVMSINGESAEGLELVAVAGMLRRATSPVR
jgi:hypothetical protein